MSNKNNTPNGMYDDGCGNFCFIDGGTVPVTQKKWFDGTVTRSAHDEKTKTRVSKTQHARVFCHDDEVVGYVLRQCPLPWPVSEYDDVKTKVTYGLARD